MRGVGAACRVRSARRHVHVADREHEPRPDGAEVVARERRERTREPERRHRHVVAEADGEVVGRAPRPLIVRLRVAAVRLALRSEPPGGRRASRSRGRRGAPASRRARCGSPVGRPRVARLGDQVVDGPARPPIVPSSWASRMTRVARPQTNLRLVGISKRSVGPHDAPRERAADRERLPGPADLGEALDRVVDAGDRRRGRSGRTRGGRPWPGRPRSRGRGRSRPRPSASTRRSGGRAPPRRCPGSRGRSRVGPTSRRRRPRPRSRGRGRRSPCRRRARGGCRAPPRGRDRGRARPPRCPGEARSRPASRRARRRSRPTPRSGSRAGRRTRGSGPRARTPRRRGAR